MDAKQIALLISQIADLAHSDELTLEMNQNLNAALWELAMLKDIREEVDGILQAGYDPQKPTHNGRFYA
jgi:hypothetical protein